MIYSENEILQYIEENDVKFVKLTFCDLRGRLKNISILSSELAVTFERGLRIAAKKIAGFAVKRKMPYKAFVFAFFFFLALWTKAHTPHRTITAPRPISAYFR